MGAAHVLAAGACAAMLTWRCATQRQTQRGRRLPAATSLHIIWLAEHSGSVAKGGLLRGPEAHVGSACWVRVEQPYRLLQVGPEFGAVSMTHLHTH